MTYTKPGVESQKLVALMVDKTSKFCREYPDHPACLN
jgi:hypothetical protein